MNGRFNMNGLSFCKRNLTFRAKISILTDKKSFTFPHSLSFFIQMTPAKFCLKAPKIETPCTRTRRIHLTYAQCTMWREKKNAKTSCSDIKQVYCYVGGKLKYTYMNVLSRTITDFYAVFQLACPAIETSLSVNMLLPAW